MNTTAMSLGDIKRYLQARYLQQPVPFAPMGVCYKQAATFFLALLGGTSLGIVIAAVVGAFIG
jgi:hypothetical protein